MPDKSNKKITVVGMGSIGKRHDRNLVELGCLTVPHDPPIYDDGQTFLDRISDCDGVVIASPTPTHYNYIMQCVETNKPIFVEKPIASNTSEWRSLRNYDLGVFVGYNLRFHPCVRQAKQWLNMEMIGQPLWASFCCAQFNDRPEYLRDGVILNWSHEIDLALHLLGPAIVQGSHVLIKNSGDYMADILLFHSKTYCPTTIHLDYVTPYEQRGFSIHGTKGSVTAMLPERKISLRQNNSEEATDKEFVGSYDTDYKDEIKAFLHAIDGKPWPGANANEALDVLEICLNVRKQAGLC